ncbi:TetR/AcrR family transcriptional regulator [Hamadaea sp. NPDC051192]|uniref:TetR/AcrR family transcriptional regulator n=1 Tax=Hamadaea sp. NPDC051192 TaxID=3154940 RepID=UPI0034481836
MSETSQPSTRGRPAKRDAIVEAARAVFGRDGYARTTTDTIAREAGVSTRTLYKHFPSKEALFSSVLAMSAVRVADAFSAYLDDGLRDATGPEEQLFVIGHALVAHGLDFPDHFALVQQINAERRHFPAEMLDGWLQAGPLRVRAEVVERLGVLVEEGVLRSGDLERMALHFTALTTFESTTLFREGRTPTREELAEMVAAGVRTFLYGYRATED